MYAHQEPHKCLWCGEDLPMKPVQDLNPPGTPPWMHFIGSVLETGDYDNHTCDPEKVLAHKARIEKSWQEREDGLINYQI